MYAINILLITIFSTAYFQRAKSFLDPDFGWSLKIGELINKSGIPAHDPFSYTMPGYRFIDHEWLTHVLMYRVYNLAGYDWLAIIFTIFGIGAVMISVYKTNPKFIPLQIIFIASSLFFFFGIRAQVISWFFFALISAFFLDEFLWKRFKYIVPAVFLLWVNLHGGFITGMILAAVHLFVKKSRQDKIIIISGLLTLFINPYGQDLLREIWFSMRDFSLRLYIIEWRPILFGATFVSLLFICFASALILHYWKKYTIPEKILYLLFLISAFSSVRNLPFFIILTVLLLNKGISQIINEIGTNPEKLRRFNIFYWLMFFAAVSLSFYQTYRDYTAAKSLSEDSYPRQAIAYLTKNLPKGRIFSIYEWGGYLIWKLPQKKVFIDGRMASWVQTAKGSESNNVFKEHIDILRLDLPLAAEFKKYCIDTVLLSRSWLEDSSDKITWNMINKFVRELKKNGFGQVYRDRTAVIYSQKNTFCH